MIRYLKFMTAILLFAIATVLSGASGVSEAYGDTGGSGADDAETYELFVSHAEPEAIAGAKLSVLSYNADINGFRTVGGIDAVFDQQARCNVNLPPGRYIFEVLSNHQPDTIVALRSNPMALRRGRKIEVIASQPVPLEVLVERKPVTLETVMVRSAATEGALKWQAKEDQQTLSLILTPNENYRLAIFANRENQRYAFWLKSRSQDLKTVTLPMDKARRLKFTWRDGGEPRDESKPAHVTLFFPDNTWRLALEPDLEIYTNRRYMEMAYSYPTPRGTSMYFHQKGYLLEKDGTIEIGGPVKAYAFIAVQKTYQSHVRYEPMLYHHVWLADESQHQLNPVESKANLKSVLHRIDGKEVPSNPLPAGSLDNLRPLSEHFYVDISYDLGTPQQIELAPVEPVEVHSAHFVMPAVPGWEWRTKVYLLRAERAYQMLGPVSEFPASSNVIIGFMTDTSRARGGWKGKRRGSKRGHINMPFRHYVHGFDAFAHTKFLVHEVAHTYGYPHGEAMSATQHEAERRYHEHRWFAADNPDYIPSIAW